MEENKIVFYDIDAPFNASSEDLAKAIVARLGVVPRKKNAKIGMDKVLIELYERRKLANQQKRPQLAIMTVEEMALFAGVKKPTMYDYLGRWLKLNLIKKASYVDQNGNIVRGYMLNGSTLEDAFSKVKESMEYFLEKTRRMIQEFQRLRKNEKISNTMKQ